MKQPLCGWMAAANGFAIYSAHMIPWPRSGMVSLPIKRRLPRKRRAVGHNPGIITALRLLYHVREAAWYNCPSKGGCRASGEPLGIARYNNRFAVIIPCAAHCRKRECPYLYHYFHAASSSRRSARASCSVSAENRNAPVRSNTSTCPRTHSIVYSIMTDTPFKQSGPAGVHQRRTPISYRRCARYPALAALLHCRIIKR